MTRKILSRLVVLLTLTLVGVPISHAQDKGQMGKSEQIEMKNKRVLEKKELKKKMREQSKDAKESRASRKGPRAQRGESKQNREGAKSWEGKNRLRELRRVPTRRKVQRSERRRAAYAKKLGQNMRRQFDAELKKHARRVARIDRLKVISKDSGNKELAKRADLLLEKESARHAQRLRGLHKTHARQGQVLEHRGRMKPQKGVTIKPGTKAKKVEEKD